MSQFGFLVQDLVQAYYQFVDECQVNETWGKTWGLQPVMGIEPTVHGIPSPEQNHSTG